MHHQYVCEAREGEAPAEPPAPRSGATCLRATHRQARSERSFRSSLGSARNLFTDFCVEAHDWQGAEAQEYRDISSFRNDVRRDAFATKM
jgi:hypothetical protein